MRTAYQGPQTGNRRGPGLKILRPTSARVGRPPVFGLVARGGCPHNTGDSSWTRLSTSASVGAAQLMGATYGWASSPLEGAPRLQKPLTGFGRAAQKNTPAFADSHPATVRGGGKLKVQSAVLPCVLARSGVSATSPRLWPAAPLTVTVQRAESKKGTMSDVLQAKGADDRQMPWPSPSTPCGARDAHLDQGVHRHVLQENAYP